MSIRKEFNSYWINHHPSTPPISYLLKKAYPDRWLRIHSLPNAKRYADNKADWKIIFDRHNSILSDLFGESQSIILVTGEYTDIEYIGIGRKYILDYSFIGLLAISLHKVFPLEFEYPQFYIPLITETTWNLDLHKELIKKIANDKMNAFFLSVDKNIIVAPYDGGIDIIFNDTQSKEYYKNKYSNWVSTHIDGL